MTSFPPFSVFFLFPARSRHSEALIYESANPCDSRMTQWEQLEGIRDLQLGDVSRCFTVLAAASVSQKATLLEWEWIE
jgi:hypothetical protein